MAACQVAAAQPGQCQSLVLRTGDLARQVQCLLVAFRGLVEVTAQPVQRSRLVQQLGFATAVTDGTGDRQRIP